MTGRQIKARQGSAIRLFARARGTGLRFVRHKRPRIVIGYQYHPPKMRWRDKWRAIIKIIKG